MTRPIGLILTLVLLATASTASAQDEGVPWEVDFGSGAAYVGYLMEGDTGRDIVTEAWLVFYDDDDTTEDVHHELVLGPSHGRWIFTLQQITETSMVIIGHQTPNPRPKPGDVFGQPGSFVAIMQSNEDGDGWGTFLSYAMTEVDAYFEELSEPGAMHEANPACQIEEAVLGQEQYCFMINPLQLLVITVYPDGSIEMLIFAMDQHGCWHLQLLPIEWGPGPRFRPIPPFQIPPP